MPLSDSVVDLSHHNELEPNSGFHAMQGAGIQAVIHKATEGQSWSDPTYLSRYQRVQQTALLWGSYHFGIGGNPTQQADFYLQTANPTASEAICLDFEDPSMSLAQAEAFVKRIFSQLGRYPILYTYTSFLRKVLGNKPSPTLSRCPLWIARYAQSVGPLPPGFSRYWLWQYTQSAQVAGVINSVDRSRFNGTVQELQDSWPL